MSFIPVESRTVGIVNADAGYMEFDLQSDLGYQEWRGMFAELGVKATLFNGYLLQRSNNDAQISTTPVQLHLFEEGIYLAPPFEAREFYFHIPRRDIQLGKVYFRIPSHLSAQSLDGYKPAREDLYALDVWTLEQQANDAANPVASLNPTRSPVLRNPGIVPQTIYTLVYEAKVHTDVRDYVIDRFESEQLFDNN